MRSRSIPCSGNRMSSATGTNPGRFDICVIATGLGIANDGLL